MANTFLKNRIYPFQISPQLLFLKLIKNLLCYTENVEVCTNGMNFNYLLFSSV